MLLIASLLTVISMGLEDHTCSLFLFRNFQLADIQNFWISQG